MKFALFFTFIVFFAGCNNNSNVGKITVSPEAQKHADSFVAADRKSDAGGMAETKQTAIPAIKEISYQQFKREKLPGMVCDWYSAIVKPMNPAKDSYKEYCRYIVKDIIGKAGTDNLVIAIYDNRKAYTMYEGINDGHILNKAGMSFVETHNIASYTGNVSADENYLLSFYQDAKNGYSDYETYRP